MKFIKFSKKGQTLVEITLAIGVSVIIITGVLSLTTNFLRSSQEFLRRSEAVKFANAGIEASVYYKNTQDFSSINSGNYQINSTGDGLTGSSSEWVAITSPTTNLTYYRKIYLAVSGNDLDVTVQVEWPNNPSTSPTNNKNVTLKRTLTNWKGN